MTPGFAPRWSARGQIAFHRGEYHDPSTHDIYVLSLRSGAVRRLAAGYAPSWSPDGRRLVFSYQVPRPSDDPIVGPVSEIATIRADGTGFRPLASGVEPSWSPDGRRIAFHDPEGYAAVISPAGRGLHRLARSSDAPMFSPDSRWLAFTRSDELYVAAVRGQRRRYVTSPAVGEEMVLLDWRAAPASETRCR